jgi:DNA sulfur modification protein DndB
MKIPAIRAKLGNWTYYTTTLTFEQVSNFVSKVDDQLHKSESLKDLIQRSLSSNYLNIKEYIINQQDLFFNSLVLAVYDDYPQWKEIEFKYDNIETYQMGILEFESTHKIFPIDGQHRVEGIKAAVAENPQLKEQRIAAIFVGHLNSDEGKQRTRRLFTTLNRYAKPVTMNDIIALDEDDSIAIATRELLESFELFTYDRVTNSSNKAIQETDKKSFTSIITLYQCNKELLKLFRKKRAVDNPQSVRDNIKLEDYLKTRPAQEEVDLFKEFCFNYWNDFLESFFAVREFTQEESELPALKFRNREDGGNLLFRPIGLLPFVQASLEIHVRTTESFKTIFDKLNGYDFTISKKPWENVIWNPIEHTMEMGGAGIVKLIILYIYNKEIMKKSEFNNLKNKYAARINNPKIDQVLDEIPLLS